MTQIVSKPWGHEEIWAHTSKYVGKKLVLSTGARLSLQYHKEKDETFLVVEGSMELQLADTVGSFHDVRTMNVGDSFHCPPMMAHRMCAGPEGCVVMEVSTPELDDIVRLADDYGRQEDKQ